MKQTQNWGWNTHFCHGDGRAKTKLKTADRLACAVALIIGDEELDNNVVTIKDLHSRTQTQVTFANLQPELQRILRV